VVVHAAPQTRGEGSLGGPSAAPPARLLTRTRSLAMLAHATRSDDRSTPLPPEGPAGDGGAAAVAFIRYLDVVLVIAATPFVILAGAPAAGFALAAVAWILTRFGVGVLESRAWGARNGTVRTALHLASILGRVWLVALVVLLARFAIGTSDGIAAAVVVLAAYTIELVTKLLLRGQITATLRRPS